MSSQKSNKLESYKKVSEKLEKEKGFSTTKFLGEGGFGAVLAIYDKKRNKEFALKIMSVYDGDGGIDEKKLKFAQKEADMLKNNQHVNIVQYIDSFLLGTNYFIQMEKCEFSLQDLVNNYGGTKIKRNTFINYAGQIINAIRFLHSRNLVLRDISLKNTLLSVDEDYFVNDGIIKLCDFGCAIEIDLQLESQKFMSTNQYGVFHFFAPEVRKQYHEENRKTYIQDFKGDIWSFGICLYILAGADPYHAAQLSYGNEVFQSQQSIDEDLNQFIKSILISNPNHRPDLEQISHSLSKLSNKNSSLIQSLKRTQEQSMNKTQFIQNLNQIPNQQQQISDSVNKFDNYKKPSIFQSINKSSQQFMNQTQQISNQNQQHNFQQQISCTISKFDNYINPSTFQSIKVPCQQLQNKTYEQYYEEGMKLKDQGKHDEAIQQFNQCLKIYHKHENANFQLGFIYNEKNMLDESLKYYLKALEINHKSEYAHNGLGNVYKDKGQYDQSISYFLKALEINPKIESAYNGLGNVYYNKGQYDQSISYYMKALEINPKFEYAYHGLGNVYYNKGQYDQSISYYMKALEINPKYQQAYNNLGIVYEDKGQYDQSISYYMKALEINPKIESAYNGLGNVYYNKGQYDQSISYYMKALEINPKYEQAYNNLGNVYYNKGQYDQSISYYMQALEINPKLEYAYNGLGNVYKNKGQYDYSISYYMKALEINPNKKIVQDNLKQCQNQLNMKKY